VWFCRASCILDSALVYLVTIFVTVVICWLTDKLIDCNATKVIKMCECECECGHMGIATSGV
jgi:hypothetical protein